MKKMSGIVKTKPIEIIENSELSTDDEIELKTNISSPQPLLEVIPKKPKRVLNLSEEERERRRQSMVLTRAKRQEKVQQKKQLELEYLKHVEEESNKSILKKAESLKKKQEKALYNKYLEEMNSKKESKKKEPKIIYESDNSESETQTESEEEIVVVKKKKNKSKTNTSKSSVVETQPESRPIFRIAY